MNRRGLLLGGTALGLVGALGPRTAVGQDIGDFICGSLDPLPGDDEFALDLMGGSATEPFSLNLGSGAQTFTMTPYGLAVTDNKWRRKDGRKPNSGIIELGVHFMNGSAADRELVIEGTNAWLQGGIENLFAFEFNNIPEEEADISILFDQGINDSLNGRKSRAAARSTKHSMRIEDRHPWVVTHEFGHALCLKHEHQHPNVPIQWNEAQVIADYGAMGIPEATVRKQVLDRLSESLICATSPDFDGRSVMMYKFRASWISGGPPLPEPSTTPSAGDIACILGIYDA